MERLWRWLFAPEPALGTHLALSGLALLMGFRLAFWPWARLAGLERPLFRPVPFLLAFDEIPSPGVLVAIQVVGVAAAAAVLILRSGRHRGTAFALSWLALLVLAGFRASRGKIQHNDLLVVIAAIPFLAVRIDRPAFARLRDVASPPMPQISGWARRSAVVVVVGSYFFAGIRKLTIAGPAWVTGDTMRWIMYGGASGRRSHWPEAARFIADRAWLAHLVAGFIVLVELGFPFFFARARLRPWLAGAVVAFHIGTWLTLGLDYWNYTVLVVLLVPDWGSAPDKGSPLWLPGRPYRLRSRIEGTEVTTVRPEGGDHPAVEWRTEASGHRRIEPY